MISAQQILTNLTLICKFFSYLSVNVCSAFFFELVVTSYLLMS